MQKKTVLPGYFCNIIIVPESDHWLPLSLTPCCSVDLIDVTLVCEDAYSKLVEVFTVVVDVIVVVVVVVTVSPGKL